MLVGGARDLPERQRTLRATIDWSAQLLSSPERDLLLRLGVFRAGFGLDAVEWMADGLGGEDAVEALGALVDGSLVREQDRGSRAWFTMLATVREYGRDLLAERGRAGRVAWNGMPTSTSRSPRRPTRRRPGRGRSSRSRASLDEHDELRAAVDHLFATRRFDAVAELAWTLYSFWWGGGRAGELRTVDVTRCSSPVSSSASDRRVIAEYCLNAIRYWAHVGRVGRPGHRPLRRLLPHGEGTGAARPSRVRRSPSRSIAQVPPDLEAAEENARCCPRPRRGSSTSRSAVRWSGSCSAGLLARAGRVRRCRASSSRRAWRSRAASATRSDRRSRSATSGGHASSIDEPDARPRVLRRAAAPRPPRIGHEEGIADALEGMFAVAAIAGRRRARRSDARRGRGHPGAQGPAHPLAASPSSSRSSSARWQGREASRSTKRARRARARRRAGRRRRARARRRPPFWGHRASGHPARVP